MAGAFTAYIALKGLKKIYKFSTNEVFIYTPVFMSIAYFLLKPFITNKVSSLENKKEDIYKLFHLPLLFV